MNKLFLVIFITSSVCNGALHEPVKVKQAPTPDQLSKLEYIKPVSPRIKKIRNQFTIWDQEENFKLEKEKQEKTTK